MCAISKIKVTRRNKIVVDKIGKRTLEVMTIKRNGNKESKCHQSNKVIR